MPDGDRQELCDWSRLQIPVAKFAAEVERLLSTEVPFRCEIHEGTRGRTDSPR